MFSKILIANRGEIAIRVIRACRELGIESVAVYSEADADCLHVQVRRRGRVHRPGAGGAELSRHAGAHPGGAAERRRGDPPRLRLPRRARRVRRLCRDQGIKFIGPSPESIELMGDKAAARATMTAAGVPVTPGSEGIIDDAPEARGRRRRHRPAGDGQGVGRRRRQGHPHRHGGRPSWPAPCVRRRPRPRRRSATAPSTWRSTSARRATSRSRCSPTARATASTSASATAPSSGATRSSSRRRRRRP